MDSKQIKLLILLADKLKNEKRSKNQILSTFKSAGILNENGEFTDNYPHLKNFEKKF